MAKLVNDTSDTLIVMDPISVKLVHTAAEGGVIEKTVTQPFCALTLDREYSFDRRHVLFAKPLNPNIAKYYDKLVEAFLKESSEDNDFNQSMFTDESQEEENEEPNDDGFLIIPSKYNVH